MRLPKPNQLAMNFIYTKALILFVAILLGGLSLAQAQAPQAADRVRVLIAFQQNPGPAEEALVRAFGGDIRYTYHLVPAIAATLPSAAIQPLQNNPRVVRIEPDGEVQAIDTELDNTWGVKHIGAGTLHDAGNLGTGVRVAIIDSGIAYTHPELIANYKGGHDFVNNDDDPMDDNDHGTHVSGTVAAKKDAIGVVGAAPQADLYGLKVLNASGSGSFSDVIAAVQWVVDNILPGAPNGIVVTNNSYGSSTNPGITVQQAFDNSYAAGVLHIAAAGNSGNPKGKGNNVGYPAAYDSVVAVAATDSSDNRASFSSTGSAVEIAAPGVAITSTVPGGGYATWSGTSMASPHVTGTAALIIYCGITDDNGDHHINDEVRARLQATADDLGDSGRDSLYGYGLVNAAAAADPLTCTTPPNHAPVVTISSPADGASFDSGASITFTGSAGDAEDGTLTDFIHWTSDGIDLGTGGSFSKTLSDGTHIITASATDLDGLTGSASITITVGTPTTTPVSVSSISYSGSGGRSHDKNLSITVQLDPVVSGASVDITLSNTTTGSSWNGSATTGTSGSVTFTLNNAPSGTYTTTVNSVSAAGYDWDGVTPNNGYTKP